MKIKLKLIRESIDNSIFQSNKNFIIEYLGSLDEKMKKTFSNIPRKYTDPINIEVYNFIKQNPEILNKIHTLTTNKIIKILGTGFHGIAFLLDDYTVLKIGYQRLPEEYETYVKIQNDLFAKKGTKHTPMIYELGKLSGSIYFLVTNKLKTIDEKESVMNNESDDSLSSFDNIYTIVHSITENKINECLQTYGKIDYKTVIRMVLPRLSLHFDKYRIPQIFPTVKKIVKMLVKNAKRGYITDEAQNIGNVGLSGDDIVQFDF